MPVSIRKPNHFEIVFNCHSKGCLNLLRFAADTAATQEAQRNAAARGWKAGIKNNGKDGSIDPWYCPEHTDLATKKHRWAFA